MGKMNMATTAMTDIVTRIQHRRTMIVIFTVRLSPFEQCQLLLLPYSILEYYSYICWILGLSCRWWLVFESIVWSTRNQPLRSMSRNRVPMCWLTLESDTTSWSMVGAARSINNNMVVWVKYKAICCCCIQIYYTPSS